MKTHAKTCPHCATLPTSQKCSLCRVNNFEERRKELCRDCAAKPRLDDRVRCLDCADKHNKRYRGKSPAARGKAPPRVHDFNRTKARADLSKLVPPRQQPDKPTTQRHNRVPRLEVVGLPSKKSTPPQFGSNAPVTLARPESSPCAIPVREVGEQWRAF